MFQVAHFRLTTQSEPSKKTPALTAHATVTVQPQPSPHQQLHASTVVIAPGVTTIMEPPSVIIDQNLLNELVKRFPEVPCELVIKIIQQKGNQREACMMELVRESPKYSSQDHRASNGPRHRSDSASSRGSIPGVLDQSPTANQTYANYSTVPYHHSASEPQMSNMVNNDPYVSPGPQTAPAQPDMFQPFPAPTQPGGTPFGNTSQGYWMHGNMPHYHPSPHSWQPNHETTRTPQSTGQYPVPAPHVDQLRNSQAPTPSRPGGFGKDFPPGKYDFSPESPNRKPPVHPPSSYPHNTHVPSPQHQKSPMVAVTTPRQAWDKTPTSPSTVFQPSPAHGQGLYRPPDSTSSTFISSLHKFIGSPPEHAPFKNPSSINIRLGGGTSQPYSLPAAGSGPHLQSSRTPPAQNSDSWYSSIDSQVKNPPNYMPHTTDIHGPASTHPAVLTQEAVASSEFHHILEGRQMRSGSLGGEDVAYFESLIRHQKERLDKLKQDIITLEDLRGDLKSQVARKDKLVLQAQRKRVVNTPSISMSDLQKVREENRSLQVDSHLLTLEFDRVTKGQAVIGSDPNEDFYARIPRGQSTPITSTETGSTTVTTVTTAQPSSHPPAPPTLVSSHDHLSHHLSHHAAHHPTHHPTQPHQLQNVRETEEEEEHWSCSACTFHNHPEINQCEMCNMPRVGRRR